MSALLRLVRRLAVAPGFRRLTHIEPLLRLSFALRGSLTKSPLGFALNELRPGRRIGVYELRDGGVFVALRHKTPDVLLFDEIFSQREYELPGPVRKLVSGLRPLKIADLGANIGLFGAFISGQCPEPEIVAIEADEENVVVLRLCAQRNDGYARWKIVPAAAATTDGTVHFRSGDYSLSRIDEEGDPVPAVDVFPYLSDAHLIKIDIEGAEWPILTDPRFRRLRAPIMVIEYHDDGCPGDDPAAEAEAILRSCGYEIELGVSKPEYRAGVIWGWREAA